MTKLNIVKQFLVTCTYCGEQSITRTWRSARDWNASHHKDCQPFQSRQRGRIPTGITVKRLTMVEATCPICGMVRLVQTSQHRTSVKKNPPERVDICNHCQMTKFSPARRHGRTRIVKGD